MSELTNTRNVELRWRLLTSVSALALLASIYNAQDALASDDDSNRPTVWIELGGQLEKQTGQGDAFIPDFAAKNLSSPGFQGVDFQSQKGTDFSNGFEGKLTFQPAESDWMFSASMIYGRANGRKSSVHMTPGHHLHHKSLYATTTKTPSGYNRYHFHCCITVSYTQIFDHAYANVQSKFDQAHAIVDFQAGRDFGLGMFGRGGTSVIGAGVRFAQFTSRSAEAIQARPSREFVKHYAHYDGYTYSNYRALPTHRYAMTENDARSFHGVGPAISWNASALLLGNLQKGEIGLDWGVNAAILFGRQRVAGNHQTTGVYDVNYSSTNYHHTGKFGRQRFVTVPNLGGFAGVSFRYAAAKVSFGYRGDFFIGAMDVGNQVRKAETVSFYGPFANVSVGIGG